MHDSGDPAHGKVMKQMATVWPVGWHGPPHAGPTTYFGPGDPQNTIVKPGIKLSFSIKLEEDAQISLVVGEPAGKGNPNPQKNLQLSIDSASGNWTCGDAAGNGARFAKSLWHNITLSMPRSETSDGVAGGAQLSLDGVVLGDAAKSATGSLQLALSRYISAMVDSFAVSGVPSSSNGYQ